MSVMEHHKWRILLRRFGDDIPLRLCQNYEISWLIVGHATLADKLAEMVMHLGCQNINFVTPEHVVPPQTLEALLLAVDHGLRYLVYNTSAYDSADSLALMDGIVDIYMPDFKF